MSALPPGWQIKPIGEVARVNPRRPGSLRSLPHDHEVSFVPMPAVDEAYGVISAAEIRPFSEVKKGFTYFEEEDVIFAKITPCMQNGKAAIARGLANGLGMGSTEFHVLRCDQNRVLPGWLWYFVRSPDFRTEATYHFQGAVGQQRVPASFLETKPLPLPPLEGQRRIVARIEELMGRVDEIRRLRADSVRDLDHTEGAVFADFVETDIRAGAVAMMKLGDLLVDTQYGTSSKANTSHSGVPILRMGNIRDGHLDTTDLKHIGLTSAEITKFRLSRGDILINRTNSLEQVGKAAVFDLEGGPWVYASYLVRLVVDQKRVLPAYASAVINSRIGRRYVLQTARRAIGMVNINVNEIRAMPIPVPSLEAQASVVGRMAEVCRSMNQLRRHLPAFEEASVRASILRKAFAGEL